MNWVATTLAMGASAYLTAALIVAGISIAGFVWLYFRTRRPRLAWSLVVEASPHAIIVIDSKGTINLINARGEAIFGFDRREAIGQPIEMLIPERFHSNSHHESIGKRKDGSDIPVEIALNPIQTSEGVFVLVSVVDITERRATEREQARYRAEMTHLSRVAMLGELSGALAHELNQPLTAILSNAQAAQEFLAQDPTDFEEVQGILQDIVDEDRRAREVIRRLRPLFRKGEVQHEPVDLNEMVLEVLMLMNHELVTHGVTVQTELAAGLPSVSGDRVQLQQVLINLIINASDAMIGSLDNNRVVSVTTDLDSDGCDRISVADTGCGIPLGEIERVFEPFHTTKRNGMGLGLSVCRTITSAHGGKLWATNNPGRGACFHVTFSPIATSPITASRIVAGVA